VLIFSHQTGGIYLTRVQNTLTLHLAMLDKLCKIGHSYYRILLGLVVIHVCWWYCWWYWATDEGFSSVIPGPMSKVLRGLYTDVFLETAVLVWRPEFAVLVLWSWCRSITLDRFQNQSVICFCMYASSKIIIIFAQVNNKDCNVYKLEYIYWRSVKNCPEDFVEVQLYYLYVAAADQTSALGLPVPSERVTVAD